MECRAPGKNAKVRHNALIQYEQWKGNSTYNIFAATSVVQYAVCPFAASTAAGGLSDAVSACATAFPAVSKDNGQWTKLARRRSLVWV